MTPKIVFIIPCLNEESNIGKAINSIKLSMGNTDFEIIVCDNGSTDETRFIAKKNGARVLIDTDANISKLRNIGASSSEADIYVFIDADVTIDETWYAQLLTSIKDWPQNKLLVSGSRCLTPEGPGLINKHWFSALEDNSSNYINSGHMIVPKNTFDLVTGFDENLKTSEDYDFCQRAKKSGA